jgi:hypothetical protein
MEQVGKQSDMGRGRSYFDCRPGAPAGAVFTVLGEILLAGSVLLPQNEHYLLATTKTRPSSSGSDSATDKS